MFNAPVFYEKIVTSTMDVSRMLAANGEPHGTVICADFQKNGRGRAQGRKWQTENEKSLLFTVLLRFSCIEDIPKALTLRTGLATADAIEEFTPSLKNKVHIKWPNDIIINERKAAGILCEADGGIVHAGIGINVSQKEFPAQLENKATSIALAAGLDIASEKRTDLLKLILMHLYKEIENKNNSDWKMRIEKRLFKINKDITFINGSADSGKEVHGTLTGITDNGELLINNRAYVTGELRI